MIDKLKKEARSIALKKRHLLGEWVDSQDKQRAYAVCLGCERTVFIDENSPAMIFGHPTRKCCYKKRFFVSVLKGWFY